MFGSIMPTPLAMPTTRAGPSPTTARAVLGTVSVVMIPRAAASRSVPVGWAGTAATPCEHVLDRVAPTDHAGRRDQQVVGIGADAFGHRRHETSGVVEPRRPVGDVGVLRDDDHAPGPTGRDVVATDRHRRSGEARPGEHPRRGHRPLGDDHDEVVGVVLHPEVGDKHPKPLRQGQSPRRASPSAHVTGASSVVPPGTARQPRERVSSDRDHHFGGMRMPPSTRMVSALR